MPPFDRHRAEIAFEAARVERARMITVALASVFETMGRFFRDMSTRAMPAPPDDASGMTAV